MSSLRPEQVAGVGYLLDAQRCYLADEPGLGKTPQAVTAAEGRTLVVAPAVLQDVWDDHVRDWQPGLDYAFTSYSRLCHRVPSARGRREVVTEELRPEYRGAWDTIIYDEAHYLKQRDAKWTKAALKLRSSNAWLLTGTPMPNWAYELYTGLVIIHGRRGAVDLNSYWRWAGRWFQLFQNPHAARQGSQFASDIGDLHPGWTWDDFAKGNQLDGRWLRRTLDESTLPPLTWQTIEVEPTDKQARLYKSLKDDAYALVEETGNEVVVWSAGGVWVKLMQASTGISSVDPAATRDESGKLQVLAELLRDRTRPTLVFCAYRNTADAIRRLCDQLHKASSVVTGAVPVEYRRMAARQFQAGELDVLVGTYGTMAEGLTLHAADTVILVECDPRPSKREQAVKRINRFGQTRPCLAIELVTKGTVDVPLRALVATKTDQQMAAIRALDLLNA